MSSATAPTTSIAVPEIDPYRYGWRIVPRPLDDGGIEYLSVPLTLEDVLHPEEDDQVTHAEPHERRCVYLYDVFRAQLAGDTSVAVLKDVRIAWDVPGLRPHGPDLMVIPGVREQKAWSTFDVAAEGTRPVLVVEVTSPGTAPIDLVDKLSHYDRADVRYYVIVDYANAMAPLRLFGYERVGDRYRGLAHDDQGRLWLPPVRVWLGIVNEELACFDEHDRPIGDFSAQVAGRQAAEKQALVEARARIEAEEQALVEARARIEAEEQALAAARARIEAEEQALVEARAREAAEERVRALEAELQRLRDAAKE